MRSSPLAVGPRERDARPVRRDRGGPRRRNNRDGFLAAEPGDLPDSGRAAPIRDERDRGSVREPRRTAVGRRTLRQADGDAAPRVDEPDVGVALVAFGDVHDVGPGRRDPRLRFPAGTGRDLIGHGLREARRTDHPPRHVGGRRDGREGRQRQEDEPRRASPLERTRLEHRARGTRFEPPAQRPQVDEHVVGRGVALVEALGEGLPDDVIEVGRDAAAVGRGRQLAVHHGVEHFAERTAAERAPAGGHLVQHDAGREDVALRPHLASVICSGDM